MKWVLWVALGLLALVILVWVYFRFFFHFGASEAEIAARLARAAFPVSHHTYATPDGQTMHYVQGGKDCRPAVVFVHGSPGDWTANEAYLRDSLLGAHTRIISIDRLGYGGSTPGVPVPSLGQHAASLRPLLEALRASGPVLLVGHSMGGPIVARAAMDMPALVDGVVMLAGSADPALEKVRGIQHFIKHRATRWLVPPDLDMSNRELIPHAEELRAMAGRWADIKQPVIIMQGKKDGLVPWQNAAYMEGRLTGTRPEMVWFPDEDHFIVWTQHDLVRQKLIALLGDVCAGQ